MVADKTSPSAYAGSALAVMGGLSVNEWAAIVGIILGVATFAVNIYFKSQHLAIERKKGSKGSVSENHD